MSRLLLAAAPMLLIISVIALGALFAWNGTDTKPRD